MVVDKNLAIGETFEFEGVLLEVVKYRGDTCKGICEHCFLKNKGIEIGKCFDDNLKTLHPMCYGAFRIDNKNVYFKPKQDVESEDRVSDSLKIDENLSVGETFEYKGVMLQVFNSLNCNECYFAKDTRCKALMNVGHIPNCDASNRSAKNNVAFKKVELNQESNQMNPKEEPIKPKVDPNLAIGETFEYNNSFYQVKLADRNYNYGECNGCSFRNRKDPHSCVSIRERGLRPNCYYTKRNDETRVIFKKVYCQTQDSQPKTIITSTPTRENNLYKEHLKNHPISLPLNTSPKVVNGEHKELSLFKRIKIRIFNLI